MITKAVEMGSWQQSAMEWWTSTDSASLCNSAAVSDFIAYVVKAWSSIKGDVHH